jgi:hypothetical protein
MVSQIKILVKCPNCNKSLMHPELRVDDLPAIDLQAKVHDKMGHIYLSQIYGSYNKSFENVDDVPGSVVEVSCPLCNSPFPVHATCECKAPMIGFSLQLGGTIKICTRNGCKNHSLEFVDANHAFSLFQSQDESRMG